MFGQFPEHLNSASDRNIGRGRYIPTTPWESIWYPVSEWLGVPESDMEEVLQFEELSCRNHRKGEGFAQVNTPMSICEEPAAVELARSSPVHRLLRAHCDFLEPACSGTPGSTGALAAGPHRTPTDETSNNNNNNNNNTKKEQYADVHLAPALSHAPMRDAVLAVVRSLGIQFPGEPIENISVFELLLGSRDSSEGFATTSAKKKR